MTVESDYSRVDAKGKEVTVPSDPENVHRVRTQGASKVGKFEIS